ncbi:hypothetical protein LTR29_003364 [Friedmanniomyces endolithicus]|nr:hypothetical protein LTR29_003364 [Friedmanniomyces endolithicus]
MADHGRSLLWVLTGSDAGGVHAQDDQHTPHQPRVARPIAVDDELLRVLLKPVGLTDHVLCLRRDICVVVSLWDSVGRKKTFASVAVATRYSPSPTTRRRRNSFYYEPNDNEVETASNLTRGSNPVLVASNDEILEQVPQFLKQAACEPKVNDSESPTKRKRQGTRVAHDLEDDELKTAPRVKDDGRFSAPRAWRRRRQVTQVAHDPGDEEVSTAPRVLDGGRIPVLPARGQLQQIAQDDGFNESETHSSCQHHLGLCYDPEEEEIETVPRVSDDDYIPSPAARKPRQKRVAHCSEADPYEGASIETVDHFLVRVPKSFTTLSCTFARSRGVASMGVEVATRGANTGSGRSVGNRTNSFAHFSALLRAVHAPVWRAVDRTML